MTSNYGLKLWLLCISLLLTRPAMGDAWKDALHIARQAHGSTGPVRAHQAADRLQAVPGTQRLQSELREADDEVSVSQAISDMNRADDVRRTPQPDAKQVADWNSRVEGVAARSEYGEANDDSAWLRKLMEDLARWLRPGSTPGGGFSTDWVMWGLLIALVVALVVAVGSWLRRSAVALPAAAPTLEVQTTAPDSAQAWWQAADREAAAGRYREAVRLGFSGTLAGLYEKADIRLDDRLTHGEMQRQLAHAGHAEASRTLLAARRVFEPVWYGMASAEADDWAHMARFRRDAA